MYKFDDSLLGLEEFNVDDETEIEEDTCCVLREAELDISPCERFEIHR